MSDSARHPSEDDGIHLEDIAMMEPENAEAGAHRRGKGASDELPEILYRLRTLHSSETFYGYFEAGGKEKPNFRTMEQLEALLEGPTANAPAANSAGAGAAAVCAPEDAGEGPGAEAGESAAEAPAPTLPEPQISLRSIVVAPTKYGRDLLEVQGTVQDTAFVNPDELLLIERPAGLDDLRRLKENLERERAAYEQCRDKIWARNLPMKLVSAHYLLDEPKILFYFAAESRVDFRELVKDLVALFKMRIELRQIGVRDEARVTGGCGVCGRVLCCHSISDKLNPVSIKMAKDQNLSLNSLKISGPCGRLLCCLSYEYQFYRDARRELPSEGVKFVYDGTLFRVIEVNALMSTVKMAGEDGRVLDMEAERFKYVDGRWQIMQE